MPIIPEKPRFRGTITYAPSPAGLAIPVADARIRIYDKDLTGSDDLLIDVKTDANGRFDKRSTRKWQDTRRVSNPFGGTMTLPDVTDTAVFFIEIDDPATGNSVKWPFGYLSDAIDVPIVVTWPAPAPAPSSGGGSSGPAIVTGVTSVITNVLNVPLIKINGSRVHSLDGPAAIWDRIKTAADKGQPITIGFADTLSHIGFPRASDGGPNVQEAMREAQQKMGLKLNTGPAASFAVDPASATIVVAAITAMVVITFIMFVAAPLALAHAAFLVMLGLAVLYALNLGYTVEVVKNDDASDPSDNSVPIPLSDLSIKLTPPQPASGGNGT